jgi:N-acetylneuraminic acid mutarotase
MRSSAHRLLVASFCASLVAFAGAFTQTAAGQTSAANQWTWMSGSATLPSSTGYLPPVYGTLGTPAAGNTPGSRIQGAGWVGSDGHLWLFGGFNLNGVPQLLYYNDLWQFDPGTSQWTWMGGSNTPTSNCPTIEGNITCGSAGVYGTEGTAGAGNWPGGRYSDATWVDSAGRLWMYGGWGIDAENQVGILGDLWAFEPSTSQWTWMGGKSTLPSTGENDQGDYGALGVLAAGNYPGSLTFASEATDPSGNTWIFGGWGFNDQDQNSLPNKLWEYDQSTGEWGWMAGPVVANPDFDPAVYGTEAVAATGNTPSSRWDVYGWAGAGGELWFFGGDGYDNSGDSGLFNQLWEFDPVGNEWAWMGGPQLLTCAAGSQNQNCGNPGVYGTQGVPADSNLPGGRSRGASWTDKDGNLWLFGGVGFDANGGFSLLNDLWEFAPSTREWSWVGGPSTVAGGSAVYGTLGVASAANLPGQRDGVTKWTDKNGNFWLYGGNGADVTGIVGILDDLWEYQPSSTTTAEGFSLSASPSSVNISPGSSGATTITTTVAGGFNSDIALTAAGQPSSVTVSFGPSSIPGAGTSTMTMTADSTAAPGAYPIEITGTGGGITKTAKVVLTVTTHPDFTISLNPTAITVQAGQSGTSTITETATGGFDGNVVYSCSGLPAGAACMFATAVVPTNPNVTYTKLTVTTGATAVAVPDPKNRPLLPVASLAALLCCIGFRRRRRLQMVLLLLLSVAGLGALSGCVVHYDPHGGGGGPVPIIVTGTSGTLQHSATLELTVN